MPFGNCYESLVTPVPGAFQSLSAQFSDFYSWTQFTQQSFLQDKSPAKMITAISCIGGFRKSL
jgi:hypothetical protein